MLNSRVPGVPNRRWPISFVLAPGVLVNYSDRGAIPVAVPQLQHDMGLNAAQIGFLLSTFAWSYGGLQIPIGMVPNRFSVKTISRLSAGLWGVASAITAMATGYWSLFIGRCLLGVAEAPSFPAISKATGHWSPRRERGLATAIFDGVTEIRECHWRASGGLGDLHLRMRARARCCRGSELCPFPDFLSVLS